MATLGAAFDEPILENFPDGHGEDGEPQGLPRIGTRYSTFEGLLVETERMEEQHQQRFAARR